MLDRLPYPASLLTGNDNKVLVGNLPSSVPLLPETPEGKYLKDDGTTDTPTASAAWGNITGTLSSQTDLNSALGGKADSGHGHAISGITGLQDALNAKSDVGHNHAGVYEPSNVNIQVHITSAHAPSDAQKNSDIIKSEIEAVLTGEISSHSHAGGGSDPWTIVKLAEDFTISTTSNNNVTGLYFTPAANKQYLILGYFSLTTVTTTVGARPGAAWPTGSTLECGWMMAASSATAFTSRIWGAGSTANAASTGLPVINEGYMAKFEAMLIMGASPSGNLQITLASETAGTNVTMRAGSFIMYREIQ